MDYFILFHGVVDTTTTILPEHLADFDLGPGYTLVEITTELREQGVTMGWRLDGTTWSPPVSTSPQADLVSLAHWFLRLSNDEVKAFNKLNVQRKTLLTTAEAFDDPQLQWLVYWDIFMTHFERLTNDIDLTHPSTIQGLQIFAALVGMTEERLDELLLP